MQTKSTNGECSMSDALPIICVASSPLQLAAFKASTYAQNRDVTLVGNRGVEGDVT